MSSGKNISRICFGILFLLFLLPWVQQLTGFIAEKKLEGHFIIPKQPELTVKTWFSGKYQDSMEVYLKSSIPLYASYIVMRNQLDFSLFGMVHTIDVHLGSEGHYFRYNDGFTNGVKLPPVETIEENVKKLSRIQKRLEEKGKYLVFVIAADKLWYYEEHLPKGAKHPTATWYYDQYALWMQKYKCNFIDLNSAFLRMKDTVSYPLFAKGGCHWTAYGGYLAMDSIATYLRENTSFSIDEIKAESFAINPKPHKPDQDVYNSLNLQFTLDEGQSFLDPKPKYKMKGKKTNAILCGDSFCNALCWNNYFMPFFGENSSHWYYNRVIYGDQLKVLGESTDPIAEELLEKSDIYIILFSAANLEKFEYDFLTHFED